MKRKESDENVVSVCLRLMEARFAYAREVADIALEAGNALLELNMACLQQQMEQGAQLARPTQGALDWQSVQHHPAWQYPSQVMNVLLDAQSRWLDVTTREVGQVQGDLVAIKAPATASQVLEQFARFDQMVRQAGQSMGEQAKAVASAVPPRSESPAARETQSAAKPAASPATKARRAVGPST